MGGGCSTSLRGKGDFAASVEAFESHLSTAFYDGEHRPGYPRTVAFTPTALHRMTHIDAQEHHLLQSLRTLRDVILVTNESDATVLLADVMSGGDPAQGGEGAAAGGEAGSPSSNVDMSTTASGMEGSTSSTVPGMDYVRRASSASSAKSPTLSEGDVAALFAPLRVMEMANCGVGDAAVLNTRLTIPDFALASLKPKATAPNPLNVDEGDADAGDGGAGEGEEGGPAPTVLALALFPHHRHLVSLDLAFNGITGEAAEAVVRALSSCPAGTARGGAYTTCCSPFLTTLSLSGNPIGRRGCVALARWLAAARPAADQAAADAAVGDAGVGAAAADSVARRTEGGNESGVAAALLSSAQDDGSKTTAPLTGLLSDGDEADGGRAVAAPRGRRSACPLTTLSLLHCGLGDDEAMLLLRALAGVPPPLPADDDDAATAQENKNNNKNDDDDDDDRDTEKDVVNDALVVLDLNYNFLTAPSLECLAREVLSVNTTLAIVRVQSRPTDEESQKAAPVDAYRRLEQACSPVHGCFLPSQPMTGALPPTAMPHSNLPQHTTDAAKAAATARNALRRRLLRRNLAGIAPFTHSLRQEVEELLAPRRGDFIAAREQRREDSHAELLRLAEAREAERNDFPVDRRAWRRHLTEQGRCLPPPSVGSISTESAGGTADDGDDSNATSSHSLAATDRPHHNHLDGDDADGQRGDDSTGDDGNNNTHVVPHIDGDANDDPASRPMSPPPQFSFSATFSSSLPYAAAEMARYDFMQSPQRITDVMRDAVDFRDKHQRRPQSQMPSCASPALTDWRRTNRRNDGNGNYIIGGGGLEVFRYANGFDAVVQVPADTLQHTLLSAKSATAAVHSSASHHHHHRHADSDGDDDDDAHPHHHRNTLCDTAVNTADPAYWQSTHRPRPPRSAPPVRVAAHELLSRPLHPCWCTPSDAAVTYSGTLHYHCRHEGNTSEAAAPSAAASAGASGTLARQRSPGATSSAGQRNVRFGKKTRGRGHDYDRDVPPGTGPIIRDSSASPTATGAGGLPAIRRAPSRRAATYHGCLGTGHRCVSESAHAAAAHHHHGGGGPTTATATATATATTVGSTANASATTAATTAAAVDDDRRFGAGAASHPRTPVEYFTAPYEPCAPNLVF